MTKQQLIFIRDMLFDGAGLIPEHDKVKMCLDCLDGINEMLKENDHGSDRNTEDN